MHLHQLRHYSATELIAAGVDIRTVAGRLGHGGGGTTTLRVYSAWVAEADQRAATSLAARMPELPVTASNGDGSPALPVATTIQDYADQSPYQQIAADLRGAMRCGALLPGDNLPTVKALADRYSVSEATAHRAMAVLAAAGEVSVSRSGVSVVVRLGGRRAGRGPGRRSSGWVVSAAALGFRGRRTSGLIPRCGCLPRRPPRISAARTTRLSSDTRPHLLTVRSTSSAVAG
ncbi:GntR family transcriptional regulator [Pseudonocardia sp. Cha107L01]|uniref:GntR family transcriptional regulator n=1 Tax=Pseudonocardia sp. Cha107L01 TaxID=3457576 RepID=UPI00403EBC5D